MPREFFRSEYKYLISNPVARMLDSRLSAVFRKDPFARENGRYFIRSLYFDDLNSSAFFDKLAGVPEREKFRIRFYNHDFSFIQLEKKEKAGSRIRKTGERITLEDAERVVRGDASFLFQRQSPLLTEFADKVRSSRLRPLLFVDYRRTAYLYPAENLRITLDEKIGAVRFRGDFSESLPAFPVLEPGTAVLEVKFDTFFPPLARDLLRDIPAQFTAVSKYCLCAEALF